jgi:hypothetical protein
MHREEREDYKENSKLQLVQDFKCPPYKTGINAANWPER